MARQFEANYGRLKNSLYAPLNTGFPIFDSKQFFMKNYIAFIALFFLVFITSCKEQKKTEAENSATEMPSEAPDGDLTAEARYQCPMDCEHGKTYEGEGKCPVCKMDLKPVSKETAMTTCKMHEGGECTCDSEDCTCENCPKHPTAQ